ncbi:MAG TPA: cytosine deaminase [Devosiaceae bacterium]|jgi:cytosine deaminase
MANPSAFILRNARVPGALLGRPADGALRRVDISVADGRIIAITTAGETVSDSLPVHDVDGGLALPAFVDMHTHLDKGHIWPRRQNPDGTFMSALNAVGEDRAAHWSAADVERRMDFALRCAYAHGTAAIRTHLDSVPPQLDVSWDVFETIRERWAGRIELQAVALMGPDDMLDDAVIRPVAERAKAAGGLLGGALGVHPQARAAVFNAVETAGELGLDLDLHCDETLDPEASALRHLADAVIETGFKGKVTAGHCCVLTVQDEATAMGTIARVAEAGVAIVSLPMCNMYLQDRQNAAFHRTPRYRGATLVNELKAAGVTVALASDNTRDPFYAYGDLDVLEVLREGARIQHFDHPAGSAWTWLRSVSADPAAIGGFAYKGQITVGAPADFMLFRARSWTELLSRPHVDRIVMRGGLSIDTTLPDYRELDDLME